MLRKILNLFAEKVAISIVDDSVIFSKFEDDTPHAIPAYVAFDQANKRKILAVGNEAKNMLGNEPSGIKSVRVIKNGEIFDFELVEALIRYAMKIKFSSLLRFIYNVFNFCRPRILVAFRSQENQVAKRAIKDAVFCAGAREVYLVEMGMASAIGMGLDIAAPGCKAVLSVSDDWFEFSIISLAGVISKITGDIGTQSFIEDIQNHIGLARRFRPEDEELHTLLFSQGLDNRAIGNVSGWEVWAGSAEQGRLISQEISSQDITIGLLPSLMRMIEAIKRTIRDLTEEQRYNLSKSDIHLTGSAVEIPGLPLLISDLLGYSVTPYESEYHPSIYGAREVLKNLELLIEVTSFKQ